MKGITGEQGQRKSGVNPVVKVFQNITVVSYEEHPTQPRPKTRADPGM